jgi:hypothetical protein
LNQVAQLGVGERVLVAGSRCGPIGSVKHRLRQY